MAMKTLKRATQSVTYALATHTIFTTQTKGGIMGRLLDIDELLEEEPEEEIHPPKIFRDISNGE
jgi:predicted KAP-like P-loop ATPase